MISEGSCDTESNDAENAALSLHIYSHRKQLFKIVFHNIAVFFLIK